MFNEVTKQRLTLNMNFNVIQMKYDLIFGKPDIIKHDLMRILYDQFIANSETIPLKIPAKTDSLNGNPKIPSDNQPKVGQLESNLSVQANDSNKIKKCPTNPSRISPGDKISHQKFRTDPMDCDNDQTLPQTHDSINTNPESIKTNKIHASHTANTVDFANNNLKQKEKTGQTVAPKQLLAPILKPAFFEIKTTNTAANSDQPHHQQQHLINPATIKKSKQKCC